MCSINSNMMRRNVDAQNQSESNSAQDLRILKHYIGGLVEEKKFNCLKDSGFFDILSKPGSHSKIERFSADIDRVAKKQKYTKNSGEHKALEVLKKEWCEEVKDIRKCIDCYELWTTSEKNTDYFTLVCTKPHLLVHVKEPKAKGSRKWPAKVLSVNDDSTVTIECFGDYLRGNYNFDECLLYSESLERAREANAMKSKLGKQKEYKRTFPEVQKYIKNIKKKFGLFVPAATNSTIIDVNQHLIEMFPGAFAKSPSVAVDLGPQSEPAEKAKNAVGTSTSYSGHTSSKRIISPVSQGYMSQGYDSDTTEDFLLEQNLPERSPIELTPTELKIEQVEEEYIYHDAQPNNESQFGAETDNGDSISEEHRVGVIDNIKKENTHKDNRKRRKDNSSVIGNSSNDDVILIDDEDEGENDSASSKKTSTLAEYRKVIENILKCEQQLKMLKKQEATIGKHLINSKK